MSDENKLHLSGGGRALTSDYDWRIYSGANRIISNNIAYIGNIIALRAWYKNVRVKFMKRDANDIACFEGALAVLEIVLKERMKRLADLAEKMKESVFALKEKSADTIIIAEQERFITEWTKIEKALWELDSKPIEIPAKFAENLDAFSGLNYIDAIRSLSDENCNDGKNWLQSIVDTATKLWRKDF